MMTAIQYLLIIIVSAILFLSVAMAVAHTVIVTYRFVSKLIKSRRR